MTPGEIDARKLHALGALSAEDLGETEEDVKVRFVVPLLEALGHTRLRFEHKGKDIVLKDGLPRGCTVVVEVKRPDLSLDPHLAQLERYALEERALLAVLTNGRLLRLYAPFWNRAKSFAETLLWELPRADLADPRHVAALSNALSHAALAGRWANAALLQRQGAIEGVWNTAEGIRQQHRERRQQLQQRLREIAQQVAGLAVEQRRCEQQLGEIAPRERDKIRRLFEVTCVPLVPSGEFGDVVSPEPEPAAAIFHSRPKKPRKRRPPALREWTDDDLRKKVTPYQARILGAFVLAGTPTLGLRQIAETVGLRPNAVSAAMAPFRYRQELSGREPLIVCQKLSAPDRKRSGHLYTIAPRHWPTLQRLYRDDARPARPKPKASRRG